MFKALWLQIKGSLRKAINDNTDLSVAGKEHIYAINQSIEDVRTERNRLAGSHLLLIKQISSTKVKLQEAKDAVRHWNKEGNKDSEDQAYAIYQTEHNALQDLETQASNLQTNITKLDNDITKLESEVNKAKTQLNTAASTQKAGQAKAAVEAIHTNLNKGPLSGVIESAELLEATAEATQQERNGKDNSSVLNINSTALSREDLLKD